MRILRKINILADYFIASCSTFSPASVLRHGTESQGFPMWQEAEQRLPALEHGHPPAHGLLSHRHLVDIFGRLVLVTIV